MKVLFQLTCTSILYFAVAEREQQTFQRLVDYYENWFERRTQEATFYEFPKDARMHEAKDTFPKGNFLAQYF